MTASVHLKQSNIHSHSLSQCRSMTASTFEMNKATAHYLWCMGGEYVCNTYMKHVCAAHSCLQMQKTAKHRGLLRLQRSLVALCSVLQFQKPETSLSKTLHIKMAQNHNASYEGPRQFVQLP